MKRKIIFIALILVCSLLMCSCDLSSLELPFGNATSAEETTVADGDLGNGSTVETTVDATAADDGDTEEETLETTVETTAQATEDLTEESTEEATRDTDDETTEELTDETSDETTDETADETTDETKTEASEESTAEHESESEKDTEENTEEITDQTTESETEIEIETEIETETETESETEAETAEESELSKLAYGKTTISGDILYVYELLEDYILAKTPASEIKFDRSRNITIDKFSDAVDIFFSDHPECFWWSGGGSYSNDKGVMSAFYPEYLFEINDIPAKRAELEVAVNEILSGVPEGSAFEKALYLHDKVAETVIYKRGTHDQTPYGALVVGEAVCNGYSTAYQLLLMRSGIRAWTVHGHSKGVAHAWTVVWLDDETCVYTDVTWDDQDTHGAILRNYFNMSLEEIDDDHTVDSVFVLPECGHNDKGYYEVIGAVVNDSDGADKIIGLFSAGENGEYSATFCYKGTDFNTWFTNHSNDIFVALGARSLSYSMLGNEVTVTATK